MPFNRERLSNFLDSEASREILSEIEPVDQLKFKDKRRYRDRIAGAQKTTGERDALVAMEGSLKGMPVVCTAFEFDFLGGSMGYAVGEKFTCAAQLSLSTGCHLSVFQLLVVHGCKRH